MFRESGVRYSPGAALFRYGTDGLGRGRCVTGESPGIPPNRVEDSGAAALHLSSYVALGVSKLQPR
ncbi:hypothetical protein J6590_052293 [Homalodisca vitripennis]|nr:hypothetical protein J6590_052293 [Homalodisca vitripennis]